MAGPVQFTRESKAGLFIATNSGSVSFGSSPADDKIQAVWKKTQQLFEGKKLKVNLSKLYITYLKEVEGEDGEKITSLEMVSLAGDVREEHKGLQKEVLEIRALLEKNKVSFGRTVDPGEKGIRAKRGESPFFKRRYLQRIVSFRSVGGLSKISARAFLDKREVQEFIEGHSIQNAGELILQMEEKIESFLEKLKRHRALLTNTAEKKDLYDELGRVDRFACYAAILATMSTGVNDRGRAEFATQLAKKILSPSSEKQIFAEGVGDLVLRDRLSWEVRNKDLRGQAFREGRAQKVDEKLSIEHILVQSMRGLSKEGLNGLLEEFGFEISDSRSVLCENLFQVLGNDI